MADKSPNEVAVVVVLEPSAGRRAEVLDLVGQAFERIRLSEPTCTYLGVHLDDDSSQIMLYERWADSSVFDQFLSTAEMVDYLTRLDALLEARRLTRWWPLAGQS